MARQAGTKGHRKVGPGMVSKHCHKRKSKRDMSGHGESDQVGALTPGDQIGRDASGSGKKAAG